MEILECIVELCVREARMLPRGECIGSRHGVALFTFAHLSEDFNGWNCSKRAEYVTDISLSLEFRAYIFSRNYSCIRERYAIIKLNGRECRVSAKSVDAISRKKNRINANWILQSIFDERVYFVFFLIQRIMILEEGLSRRPVFSWRIKLVLNNAHLYVTYVFQVCSRRALHGIKREMRKLVNRIGSFMPLLLL